VIISVSDVGVGIAPAEVEKIFHPFYTTKDSGTGLALLWPIGLLKLITAKFGYVIIRASWPDGKGTK
jgi:nitrogen-specific signal transduction histidine kinase